MMLITTSRKPGQLTRAIARTLADALGAGYLNRGKSGIQAVFEEADGAGADKVLFVWERFGNPSRLVGFDMQKARAMEAAQGARETERQDGKGGQDADDQKEKRKETGENTPSNKKKAVVRPGVKEAPQDVEGQGQKDAEAEETPWMKPEISIHGAVFHRRSIRHKGAIVSAEDEFGGKAATLLQAREGPNQIVLSRFGLKIFVDHDSVLELKFRT
ncbi:hypothetical protein HYV43_04045 [Candidatus Micrarchaeota archaeon]|nr:hypothetical protein [Candidatus Micrarchaeota archaeon]